MLGQEAASLAWEQPERTAAVAKAVADAVKEGGGEWLPLIMHMV